MNLFDYKYHIEICVDQRALHINCTTQHVKPYLSDKGFTLIKISYHGNLIVMHEVVFKNDEYLLNPNGIKWAASGSIIKIDHTTTFQEIMNDHCEKYMPFIKREYDESC